MNQDNSPQVNQFIPTLLTVRQFCERHSWATAGGIRHLIFNESSNGFSKCIRRVGRKVLLNEAEVFSWIDENNGGNANA